MGPGAHLSSNISFQFAVRSRENAFVEGSIRGDSWRWTTQRTRTSHYCEDSSFRHICKTSKMSLMTCTMKTIGKLTFVS